MHMLLNQSVLIQKTPSGSFNDRKLGYGITVDKVEGIINKVHQIRNKG
jgi:hypothetical protein